MKITLGCSMRHKDLLEEIYSELLAKGLQPEFPNLNYTPKSTDGVLDIHEKKQLAFEHYAAIDKSNYLYILTPNGYMGTSCKLELGYAVAKGKKIFFSEPTHDLGLDCYVSDFVKITELDKFLKIVAQETGE